MKRLAHYLRVAQLNWLLTESAKYYVGISFSYLIQPIAFEALGALNSMAVDLLTELAASSNEHRAGATSVLSRVHFLIAAL